MTAVGGLLSTALLCSQERTDCDTEVLNRTERRLGHLEGEDWSAFFGAISPECRGDERFMGWVNDLLFRALEAQPAEFICAFGGLPRITQRLILDELSAPGHPGLDAIRTYDAARDAEGHAASKQRILQALTKAGCRCETELLN